MVLGRSAAEGGWALFASRALFPFTQSQSGRKWVSCPASLVFSTAKSCLSPAGKLSSSAHPHASPCNSSRASSPSSASPGSAQCSLEFFYFLPQKKTPKQQNTQAALPVPFYVIVQNVAVTPTGFLLGFTQLWALGALNKGIYAWTWQWQAFLLA